MKNIHKKTGSTDELMRLLSESQDIQAFIEKGHLSDNFTVPEYLEFLLQQNNLKKARVIEKAGIDRIYGYEIFRGKKVPGRDTLLRLLITLEVGVSDIQHILKNTGYPILYPKNIRDAIIIYGIQRSLDVDRLNVNLYDFGQKTI